MVRRRKGVRRRAGQGCNSYRKEGREFDGKRRS